MKYELHNFRLAGEILSHRSAWNEFKKVVADLTPDQILEFHEQCSTKSAPAGGQKALNAYFRSRLTQIGWVSEPRLFAREQRELKGWKMDFSKQRIGVEISFNHAEAIPWIFSRLNIAGESERVQNDSKIDVGIAVFAKETLKKWAKIDSSAGTFELATAWLKEMKPILPIPIMVVGLDANAWKPTTAFRGTGKGTRQFTHPTAT